MHTQSQVELQNPVRVQSPVELQSPVKVTGVADGADYTGVVIALIVGFIVGKLMR